MAISDLVASLRDAAQATTPTNAQLLAEWHKTDAQYKYAQKVSGEKAREKGEILSAGLGLVGLLGMIGVAASNQSLGIATSHVSLALGASVLSGVGATLAGLGTVAIGGVVLPVATIATLGASVIGVVGLAISACRPVDQAKGQAAARDKATDIVVNGVFDPAGRSGDIEVGNWITGAKNMIGSSVDRFVKASILGAVKDNALITANSFDKIMNQFEAEIEAKGGSYGAKWPDKESGQYNGKLLAENAQFILMNTGRNAVLFSRSALPSGLAIKKDDCLNVKYKGGVAIATNTTNGRVAVVER